MESKIDKTRRPRVALFVGFATHAAVFCVFGWALATASDRPGEAFGIIIVAPIYAVTLLGQGYGIGLVTTAFMVSLLTGILVVAAMLRPAVLLVLAAHLCFLCYWILAMVLVGMHL